MLLVKRQFSFEFLFLFRRLGSCNLCFQPGGLFLQLVVDDKLKEMILKTQDANALRRQAVESGMRTLRQSAILKVLDGITSIEEAIQKTQTEEFE